MRRGIYTHDSTTLPKTRVAFALCLNMIPQQKRKSFLKSPDIGRCCVPAEEYFYVVKEFVDSSITSQRMPYYKLRSNYCQIYNVVLGAYLGLHQSIDLEPYVLKSIVMDDLVYHFQYMHCISILIYYQVCQSYHFGSRTPEPNCIP